MKLRELQKPRNPDINLSHGLILFSPSIKTQTKTKNNNKIRWSENGRAKHSKVKGATDRSYEVSCAAIGTNKET